MRKSVTAALSLFGITMSHASPSQVIEMNATKRLEVSISKDNLNRVAVTNDRITQVFGDEEAYVIQVDENSGQVFIKPSELNGAKPISLTLITENGHTQDITLKPFEREASTVLLKSDASLKEKQTGKYEKAEGPILEKSVPAQEKLVTAMKMLVSGQLPFIEGKESLRNCPGGMSLVSQKQYQVGPFKGHMYEVANTTETLMDLEERIFYHPRDLALSFGKRVLKPSETTKLWVISR